MRLALLRGGLAALALVGGSPGWANAADLETVFREVAATNPTLAARRATSEAKRREIGPAGAWSSPMVELGVVNVPTSGGFDRDPMTMKEIEVTQRVPLFGSLGLARGSATAAAVGADANAQTALLELLSMSWEAYADAYYANRLAASAAGHQGEIDRLVRAARARYESGSGRLDDVLRAQAEQAQAMAEIASFQAEAYAARVRLDALRGRPPGGAPDTLAPPPFSVVPEEPTTWLAAITDAHPRLLELSAEAERYRFGASASRRSQWPDLELAASYGWREPIAGVPQDDMWSASVAFELPIFAGQRQRAVGAEMDAMARASESELQAATLDLTQEIRGLHARARASQRRITLLADTVVAASRQAVEATWSAYSAGGSDLWRVLESTHDLYVEEVALVRARQELAHTRARVLAVTGRGDVVGVSLPRLERSRP